MFALVITGPPGSGKTEIAASLHDSLGAAGIDTALVEIDALERSYPPIDRRRSLSHLAVMASSYRDIGAELFVITATIEDEAHREAVLEAVGAEETMVVRLEADPQTLRERILAREAPGWGGLPDLINASRRLAESMQELPGVDLVLSTEEGQPADVATSIEAALRGRSAIPS
jgi:predicted kinase